MSESSIEIDDHAAHLNQSPVQSGIYSSKQALDDIKPDKWNNIPYPLVDCIKLILKDLKNRDKKFHEHSLIYDEFVAKTEFQRNRMEKDVERRDDQYEAKLNRLEKNITTIYNNQRKQLETDITEIKKHLDKVDNDSSNAISQIKMKLSKVDESNIIKLFVEDCVQESQFLLQRIIDRTVEDFDLKLQNFYNNNMKVDGIIGENEQLAHFTDFIRKCNETTEFIPNIFDLIKTNDQRMDSIQLEIKQMLANEIDLVKKSMIETFDVEIQNSSIKLSEIMDAKVKEEISKINVKFDQSIIELK